MEGKTQKKGRAGYLTGAVLVGIGICLLIAKALSPEYVDADGILHEAFFLLPMAAVCVAGGLGTVVGTAIRKRENRKTK